MYAIVQHNKAKLLHLYSVIETGLSLVSVNVCPGVEVNCSSIVVKVFLGIFLSKENIQYKEKVSLIHTQPY